MRESGSDSCQEFTCRLCGAPVRETFVNLGMSPLCESFIAKDAVDAMEPYYPLHALVCRECFLVQLREYVTPDDIFREYAYFSSYSSSWVAHAKAYCETIAKRLSLGRDSLVIELASNDGYLLQHFPPLGIPCLGIEPAINVAKVAIDKGIPTITEFFGVALARKLVAEGKAADLVVGNNVLAQVPDLSDFVAGIPIVLKPEGVATLEFPHLERLIDENQFDTIYHEHFSYFSFTTIQILARLHGLKVVDVEQLPTHGGSLRVHFARETSRRTATNAVAALRARENAAGFSDIGFYTGFGDKVQKTKRGILRCLSDIKDAGGRICGYGAPGKGNTLLNYCGIGPDFLDFTVDRNPYKHGRYTPGMRIPIFPVEKIEAAKPDYLFILPWNLKTEIMHQMSHIADWGGKFIVPIPNPQIVDPKDVH
ncbi:class I SAM-dependent methyltransferase [Rhodomicrobium sp. Az07]|uniref:class I SAM-dependent methyltransferase n=1 Tax=Rhodomicrobium sp. Az07 TaxID=2839034 RepID=UPI001BE97883|nr:class I SAM-dependent methyltransferase [Rhodomicrobium sp. Az07]MBT3069832.1 class I SAM-dependent methyltransferase [Rhodomicrobium sp. Az07]